MGRPFLPRPHCLYCGAVCKGRERTFCSHKCRGAYDAGKSRSDLIGNQHAFKEANATTWAQYKRMQRLCSPGPCSECGSIKDSVIHHKDHNPSNTTPENLVRMCRACHMKHHYKEIKGYDLNKNFKINLGGNNT